MQGLVGNGEECEAEELDGEADEDEGEALSHARKEHECGEDDRHTGNHQDKGHEAQAGGPFLVLRRCRMA